mmetsp:Transcript_35992/g.70817  ORF Transcript_35992/g.70817 Transcript_35992/m.70817 type:complete len:168 (+) Transcript_35992:146-649(+)
MYKNNCTPGPRPVCQVALSTDPYLDWQWEESDHEDGISEDTSGETSTRLPGEKDGNASKKKKRRIQGALEYAAAFGLRTNTNTGLGTTSQRATVTWTPSTPWWGERSLKEAADLLKDKINEQLQAALGGSIKSIDMRGAEAGRVTVSGLFSDIRGFRMEDRDFLISK